MTRISSNGLSTTLQNTESLETTTLRAYGEAVIARNYAQLLVRKTAPFGDLLLWLDDGKSEEERGREKQQRLVVSRLLELGIISETDRAEVQGEVSKMIVAILKVHGFEEPSVWEGFKFFFNASFGKLYWQAWVEALREVNSVYSNAENRGRDYLNAKTLR
jgi:hypothetical protein